MSQAQTTNITPSGLGTEVRPPVAGTTSIVGGTTAESAESNLFHSFGNFSIGAGEIARFETNSGLANTNISNILSRVTGGSPSNIFGAINSQTFFPNANLFLLNPAGFLFGATASLQIGGSMYVSTADYLRMTDNSIFYANPAQPTLLSIWPVTAFGFLGGTPAPISIQQSILGVENGKTLSFIGGELTMQGANLGPNSSSAQNNLQAEGGVIDLVSLGSPAHPTATAGGEVPVGIADQTLPLLSSNFLSLGSIRLYGQAHVSASSGIGPGSGSIVIRGGKITFENESILASSNVNLPGAPVGVDIQASEDITLVGHSQIGTFAGGSAASGGILVQAKNVAVMENSSLNSGVGDSGNAGSISLKASDLIALEDASILSSSSPFTSGKPGQIVIEANELTMTRQAVVSSHTQGTGDAGNLTVKAKNVTLTGGLFPSAVRIRADTLGPGNAGDIIISADKLTVNGSRANISSVTAPDNFQMPGRGSAGSISVYGYDGASTTASEVRLLNGGIVTTESQGPGRGGSISVLAQNLTINSGAGILATTSGAGEAGTIAIMAPALTMSQGQIATGTTATGNAGAITLNVGQLIATESAQVSSNSTFGGSTAGRAGTITIQGVNGTAGSATSVSLDNSTINTTIDGGTSLTTPATIDITAQTVNLTNGAQIKADTSGAARAGNIAFNVGTLRANMNPDGTPIPSAFGVMIRSASNHLSSSAGPAGTVTVSGPGAEPTDAATLVTLSRTTLSTEVTGSRADKPGTISITADTVVLQDQTSIFSNTGSGSGGVESFESVTPAGNIFLNVDTLRAHNNVFITSSSVGEFDVFNGTQLPKSFINLGDAGTITIRGITAGSAATAVTFANMELRTAGSGGTQPGNITIEANVLDLREGAFRADTLGKAPAGTITLHVGTLKTDSATITSRSGFEANNININAPGRAGAIMIEGIASPADTITLADTKVTTEAGTEGAAGGPITITGTTVDLGGTLITANTAGAANAGAITFNAGTLTLNDTFVTSSSTSTETNAGNAGSVTMTATGSFTSSVSTVATSAQQGAGGNVSIAAGDMRLTGITTISAESAGSKDAGSIALTSANDLLMRNSTVTTSAAQASGGNIKLTAPHLIHLVDSTLTSSVQGQAGSNGGNINIDPQLVVIQNSQLLATANAGAGGNITIAASGAVLVDPNSQLDASAGPAGVSGSVNINSPIQVLSGTLVPLKLAYTQAGLSGDRCAADPTGRFSSFVQTGRDGVPQVPGALSPSPLSFLETLTSGSLRSQGPNWPAARLGLDLVSIDDSTLFRFHSACRS
jgi:filamentous hemagglutinin family protein